MPPKRQYKAKWPGQEPVGEDMKRQEADFKARMEAASSSSGPGPSPFLGPPPAEHLMDNKFLDILEFDQPESPLPPRTPTPESSDHGDGVEEQPAGDDDVDWGGDTTKKKV